MARSSKTWTLSAVATDETGETDWLEGSPDERGDVVFSIDVTGTITITFYATVDGTFVSTILAYPVNSTTGATTATADGLYWVDSSGLRVKAKVTTAGGGSAVVKAGFCGS